MPSRVVPWLLAAVGLVALGLCAAAVGTLWRTGSLVVRRERSRAEATRALVDAAAPLARQAAPAWEFVPPWPATLSAPEWEVIDAFLADQSARALADFPRVESGFFLPAHELYLGHARGSARPSPAGPDPLDDPEPPPAARETVRSQIRLTLARAQPQLTISGPTADPLAVRTAPIPGPDGQAVAVLWTTTRLGSPLFQDLEAAEGYRSAASLSVAGIGLALVLALALAWATRRHALERARLRAELRRSERLAALGKLLAGVAHEVRNPLAGIRSSVQLWQRGLGPDDGSMASVVAEVDRIDGLVAQLLRFSRAQPPRLVPGDLNDLVREAADLAAPDADARGVRVELRLDDRLPPVEIDPPALLQVLRNLTRNALQAMPEGGRLLLSTHLAPGGRAAEARVADTGPGLSAETRAHLFEPFFTTRPEGTGLGLAIAREIALAHRGDLLASDAPPSSALQTAGSPPPAGPGAQFTLRLPLRVS